MSVRQTATPIKHVIIIIQENHAFDNYFSQFPGAFGSPPGGVLQPYTQTGVKGYANNYYVNWGYSGNQSSSDPAHDVENIWGNMDNGSMDGFTYTDTNTSNALYPSYIVANELGLGEEYGVADNYFQAYAGPTTPNRFYYYADTSGPVTTNPGLFSSVQTVSFPSLPLELSNNSISWGDFDGNYGENPNSTCLPGVTWPTGPSCYFTTSLVQLMPSLYFYYTQQFQGQAAHLQPWYNLYSDLYTGNLPTVSWYTQDWLNGTEHPGTIAGFGGNVTQGQQGIDGVLRAIENSPYWNSTAVFLSYDEGGGFYDHVPAPDINGLGAGVRIPLVVISPYAKEGYISHQYYTPSSLLHFIEYNWNLPPLGELDAMANLPLDFFNFSETPRAPLPMSDYGGTNQLTSFPWPLQPVAAGFTGSYKPELVSQGNVSWSYQTQNVLLSSPVITADGNHLYVAGMDGQLRAFDPTTGGLQWSANLGNASRSVPALLPSDGVIATTLHGGVEAYSSTGAILWNITLGAPIYGGLALVQGNYYGALSNGTLFGVSENGSVLWERSVSTDRMYSTPVYDPSTGFLLASENPGGVVAVSLSGAASWNAAVPGGVYQSGALSSGTLYVTSTLGGVYPITTSSGTVGTPSALPGVSLTSPVIVGSTLLASNSTGFLQAYSLPSLSTTWSEDLYGDVGGSPVVFNGDLWVGTGGGFLYQLPMTGGAPINIFHSGTSFYATPSATSSHLYFVAEDGNVYAMAAPPVPPAKGWAAGSVTDSSTGSTISGATLSLTSSGGPATATTGTNGAYNVSLLPGTYGVYVNQTGYTNYVSSLSVSAHATTTLNIALTPVGGGGIKPGILAVHLSPATATLSINGSAQTVQSTGTYSISLHPGGPYLLGASATGYNPQSTSLTILSALTAYWNVTLQASGGGAPQPGWVAGTVTNATSHGSLSNVNLNFRSSAGPGSASSGAAGTFNATLNVGTYAVFVNETGYQPWVGSVTVTSSKTSTLAVALVPVTGAGPLPGTVSGTVSTGTGSAQSLLSGIQLLFLPSGKTVNSGTAGTFSVSLPAGTYSIFVNASGYQPFVLNGITVTAGGTTTQNVVLTPTSSGCTPGTSGCPTTKTGNTAAPIDWLLWLLVFAVVAAAVVVFAVVLLRRRKTHQMPPELQSRVDQSAEPAAADPSAYEAQPVEPDPNAGADPPPESPPS